ncbi:hypothetical protein BDF21DRAFT_441511 [Thamnidium elegans]|nr:hypothetical protein BDF21DRAFT_441511 [Thamnidium elegans]
MLHVVYTSTPPEWLQQMTRWQYFTPESLEEMTQEGLEEIFAQYAQTIEAFRPIKPIFQYEDEIFEDEDDGQGDDLWIAEEEIETILPVIEAATTTTTATTKTNNSNNNLDSIFSQPNATLSNESVEFAIVRAPSPLSEKPLPANPVINDDTAKQARRKSGFGKNRLSWTSDTGITSSVVSQNLANEIMSLFDMDFSIDIKVDTAPKLPELPFKPRRRSQQRQSQDMLTTLIPAFEKIALENSFQLFSPANNDVLPQKPKPTLVIRSVPQRSSSLKHRQELLSPPATPDSPVDKSLTKKKSLLRLASLITVKKHHHLPASPEPSPIIQQQQQHQQQSYFNEPVITTTPRKTSTSTVDSTSSSSSWSFVSDNEYKVPQKPLPQPPSSPDLIPTTTTTTITTINDTRARTSSKKKRRSVMEKTMSKRKSNHGLKTLYDVPSPEEKGLSRSKSAFIKIGNGLKAKKAKQIRRTSSAKDILDLQPLYTGEHYHTTNDVNQLYGSSEENASFTHMTYLLMNLNNRYKWNKVFTKKIQRFLDFNPLVVTSNL